MCDGLNHCVYADGGEGEVVVVLLSRWWYGRYEVCTYISITVLLKITVLIQVYVELVSVQLVRIATSVHSKCTCALRVSAHCDVSAQQVHISTNVSAHQVRSGSQDLTRGRCLSDNGPFLS